MLDKRVCFIEVETNDNGRRELKRLDGLAIKGRISRKMGSVLSDARISVANLKRSQVEYLTTYTSPYVNPSVRKKINIYAGYEKAGWGRIFTGDIYKALPEGMPDTWVNIEAKSLFYQNRVPLSYGLQNVTMEEAGKSIATNLGLSFEWQASSQKTLDVFNFSGSQAQLIKEYNELDDVVMFEDNGVLKVVDKIAKRGDKTAKLVNENSGLIGQPEPDQFGVKFKCLLDASLYCGDWVKLESRVLPMINGYYQVYTIDFDFASREQQFYCEIYAKNYGVA